MKFSFAIWANGNTKNIFVALSYSQLFKFIQLWWLSAAEETQKWEKGDGQVNGIFQNILFYVQHKKETHTGLEWHEGE